MKILHTSDLHLGKTLKNYSLLRNQKAMKESLLNIIDSENIDVVLISGDIFDTSTGTKEAINLYSELISDISNRDVKVIIIAGNHDGAARVSQLSEIVSKLGIYILTGLEDALKPIEIKKGDEVLQFFGLSYFNMENVKARYDEEITTYSQCYQHLIESMKDKFKKDSKQILLAHAFVKGSKTSDSDCLTMVGTSEEVDASLFKDFYYVALGHLHSPQDVAKNVRYSGSPLKYSFSEANQKKSVTILDTLKDSRYEVPIVPLEDLVVYEGEYQDLLKKAQNLPKTNDYVKLVITDKAAVFSVFNIFQEHFPNLAGIEVNRENVEVREKKDIEDLNTLPTLDVIKNFYADIVKEEFKDEYEDLVAQAFIEEEE